MIIDLLLVYFSISNVRLLSSDINECLGNNSCSIYANCTNTIGLYLCSCVVGFEGDGINCTSE